jgi:hypothetical protein
MTTLNKVHFWWFFYVGVVLTDVPGVQKVPLLRLWCTHLWLFLLSFSFVLATFGSTVTAQALVYVGCCLIDWWSVLHKAVFAWNTSIILVNWLLWQRACTHGLIIKSKQFMYFSTTLACFSGWRRGAYADVRMWCFVLQSCLVEMLQLWHFAAWFLCSLVRYSSFAAAGGAGNTSEWLSLLIIAIMLCSNNSPVVTNAVASSWGWFTVSSPLYVADTLLCLSSSILMMQLPVRRLACIFGVWGGGVVGGHLEPRLVILYWNRV